MTSTIFNFAHDTCPLNTKKSIKEKNTSANIDLQIFTLWLNSNDISLNTIKTDVKIFEHKNTGFDTDLKLRLCGKKVNL